MPRVVKIELGFNLIGSLRQVPLSQPLFHFSAGGGYLKHPRKVTAFGSLCPKRICTQREGKKWGGAGRGKGESDAATAAAAAATVLERELLPGFRSGG